MCSERYSPSNSVHWDVLTDHDVLELWNLKNSAYEKLGSKCREMPKKFNRFGSEEPDAEWDGTSD